MKRQRRKWSVLISTDKRRKWSVQWCSENECIVRSIDRRGYVRSRSSTYNQFSGDVVPCGGVVCLDEEEAVAIRAGNQLEQKLHFGGKLQNILPKNEHSLRIFYGETKRDIHVQLFRLLFSMQYQIMCLFLINIFQILGPLWKSGSIDAMLCILELRASA